MRIVTLINIEDVHLNKDVGLIPFGMYKYCGFEAIIATYDNGPYANRRGGVHLEYIKKITGLFDIDSLLWIVSHSRQIDILNVYHLRFVTLSKAFLFKILNPKGKVYLKLDGGCLKENLSLLRKRAYQKLINISDLISVETDEKTAVTLSKSWNHNISYITNPFYFDSDVEFVPFSKRENIILTVGRLGSEPKATDILLEAFAKAFPYIEGWRLVLVGPLEKKETNFQEYVEKWLMVHGGIADKITFTGPISDREEIKRIYQLSKIFCFPSRHESFGLVLTEAAANGNYIIGTDIPSTRIITKDFTLGDYAQVDDIEGLCNCLIKACNDSNIESTARKLYESVLEEYSLKKISKKIELLLRK